LIPSLNFDRTLDQPVYRQLVHTVLLRIRDGSLVSGARLPSERELSEELGVARGTVQKAFAELFRLGVVTSVHGSGTYVSAFAPARLRSTSPASPDDPVRIVGIDCNPEALSIFESQFKDHPSIGFIPRLLDDLRASAPETESLDSFDLLLTTTSHDSELRRLFPRLTDRILPVAVSPSQRTVVEMARIPHDAAVGVICRSERFRRIIEGNLDALGLSSGPLDFLSEDVLLRPDREAARRRLSTFLETVTVVVVPPDTALYDVDDTFSEALAHYAERGGRIVPFEYRIDRGSLVHIEEAVDRIQAHRREIEAEGGMNHV
jgi:DNA-binding transcriptional regulator YhcF (GntR family)